MCNRIRLSPLMALLALALVAAQASGQSSSPLPVSQVFFNYHHFSSHSQFEASEFLLGLDEPGRGPRATDVTWVFRVTSTGNELIGDVDIDAPRGSLTKVIFSVCGPDTGPHFLCANGEEVGTIEVDDAKRVAYRLTVAVNHLKSKGSSEDPVSRSAPSSVRVRGAVTVFDLETGETKTQVGIDLPQKLLVFEDRDS